MGFQKGRENFIVSKARIQNFDIETSFLKEHVYYIVRLTKIYLINWEMVQLIQVKRVQDQGKTSVTHVG